MKNCLAMRSFYSRQLRVVEDEAFSMCHSLTKVSSNLIERIGPSAFASCFSLYSMKLPNVKSIGPNAFDKCLIKQVVCRNAEQVDQNAFSKCEEVNLVCCCQTKVENAKMTDTELKLPEVICFQFRERKNMLSRLQNMKTNLEVLSAAVEHSG